MRGERQVRVLVKTMGHGKFRALLQRMGVGGRRGVKETDIFRIL